MGECPAAGRSGTRSPTREHRFCIRGWAAWAPGKETESSWRDWARAQGVPAQTNDPVQPAVPAILRRRVSPLGQAALRVAWGLSDIADARVILASRHGEFGRTLSILDSIVARSDVSPADFTLSVHNALAGLLSIAARNRQGHTAVAAGRDTFAVGFLEALACLVERPLEPVILLYYDEPLPVPFDHFDETREPPFAMALTLANDGGEMFGFTTGAEAVNMSEQPLQALDFLRFILTDRPALMSRSGQLCWQWRRHAAVA